MQTQNGYPSYRELVDNDYRRSYGRKIGVINQLDPEKYNFDVEKIRKFIDEEDDTNYLIIDNLDHDFTVDMQTLRDSRKEAEALT